MASRADFIGASPVRLLPVEPARVGLADRSSTRWVSLQRACEILGVNESTVRRWADAGEIQMFRTSGGHRRFDEAGLVRLVERGVREPSRGVDPATASRLRSWHPAHAGRAGSYSAVGEDGRDALRSLGRQLVRIVDDYLMPAATLAVEMGAHRRGLEREVTAIGIAYGEELRRRQMPLSAAVQAFTSVRRALDQTAKQIAERERMSPAGATRAREQVALLADRVLLALGTVYER